MVATETAEDPVAVLQRALWFSRAQTRGVPETQVRPPDRKIAIAILKQFTDGADVKTWIESTIHRQLARKSESAATWGLWLKDAESEAPQIRLNRLSGKPCKPETKMERALRIPLLSTGQRSILKGMMVSAYSATEVYTSP